MHSTLRYHVWLWRGRVFIQRYHLRCFVKERLHGSPRLINTVESTKVNRVNSSFQRKWSTSLTGEQVGDGQLSFNVVDSLWVTHHKLRVTSKSRPVPHCRTSCYSVCLVLLIWLLNFVNYFLTPSRTSSFGAILKSTASFKTVEFNVVDSTVLINLGDPCKRTLKHKGDESSWEYVLPSTMHYVTARLWYLFSSNCLFVQTWINTVKTGDQAFSPNTFVNLNYRNLPYGYSINIIQIYSV
jgi:hypothetical protein